jgi:hypothetical protein
MLKEEYFTESAPSMMVLEGDPQKTMGSVAVPCRPVMVPFLAIEGPLPPFSSLVIW